ncbi:Universal stress protein family protein (plasmid) [Labrenzia sp. THAF191b]|uniref:universal stress protein n=1 Tax=unclassified Labrenzia TaxID=2648686 RepID=UPI001267A97D|nr:MULTISPECIES: universal stress protein [unclassified Labrenzia]QFT01384.1 Universal stress protein family protein [Labrenzia sp. THAF191b]QFT08090.1 Universal stress protein family protein [Labrenzia sp. THAF191a]QFT19545.1 Universal stress protein family protein [Labrenzia sp. THAF187b]
MTYKTILAITELDVSAETVGKAVTVAKAFDAHLTVLPIGEVPQLPFYGSGGHGYIEIWAKEFDQRKIELTSLASRVEAQLAREGISFDVRPSLSSTARQDNLVARHAIYCDLAVVLRSVEQELNSVEKNAIDGALFDSGRPVLYVPSSFKADHIGTKVAIAWNSRREAARAVSESLPFLKSAEEITLLLVDPVVGDNDHGEDPGSDIATVLARHGLGISVQSVASADRPVSEALLDSVRELGADLLVMGAYGHSRLRENILGGTTREMLEQTVIPLLLSR